jgi:uracil-DNA glycosylase
VFTGDSSGDFLWRSLHGVGLADRSESRRAGDGLTLRGVRIAAAVRCAPPANKPTPWEQSTCRPYLAREIELLPRLRVLLALGAIGWAAALRCLADLGHPVARPAPAFGHGAEVAVGPYALLGSYHVSQQNTFTGKLTRPMFEAVLWRAKDLGGIGAEA